MKFPYAVKYNGKIYPANAEIPEKVDEKCDEKSGAKPKKEATTSKRKTAKGDK